MPAPNLKSKNLSQYIHIYNKGIESRNLFNDSEDIQVFTNYLKEYLSPPTDPKKNKKSFSINGKTFKGVPHQPKNYFSKLELIAYSLLPEHFHLVTKEIVPGSVQKFIRSICTRYVIYYNKKHQRTGSLFQGPYKSSKVENKHNLLLLTKHIHQESINSPLNSSSSYEEFLNPSNTAWLKPGEILDLFNQKGWTKLNKFEGYKNFLKNYQIDEKEAEALNKIVIENIHNEGKKEILENKSSEKIQKQTVQETQISNNVVQKPGNQALAYATSATLVFVVLFSFGFKNVQNTTPSGQEIASIPSPTPQVSGATSSSDNVITPTPIDEETTSENKVEKIVEVIVNDPEDIVNIRKEPNIESEVIANAKSGDTFEFVSEIAGWYEIILVNGEKAFISKSVSQLVEK